MTVQRWSVAGGVREGREHISVAIFLALFATEWVLRKTNGLL